MQSALSSDTRSFNSRTLGRVRQDHEAHNHSKVHVSIHAPWEGCDKSSAVAYAWFIWVSIHAPWEGCDSAFSLVTLNSLKFQFTHPGKGATGRWQRRAGVCGSFNSRTLGRVRLGKITPNSFEIYTFQFTHPGKGATSFFSMRTRPSERFQFTHPGKGATKRRACYQGRARVSIHAPWEGCDRLRRSIEA